MKPILVQLLVLSVIGSVCEAEEVWTTHRCNHDAKEILQFKNVKLLENLVFIIEGGDSMFNDFGDVPERLSHKEIIYDAETNVLRDELCLVRVDFFYISDTEFRMVFFCEAILFRVVRCFIQDGKKYYKYEALESEDPCKTDSNKIFYLDDITIQTDYATFVSFAMCRKTILKEIYLLPTQEILLLEHGTLNLFYNHYFAAKFPDLDVTTLIKKPLECQCFQLLDKKFCRKTRKAYFNQTVPATPTEPAEASTTLVSVIWFSSMSNSLVLFGIAGYCTLYCGYLYHQKKRVVPNAGLEVRTFAVEPEAENFLAEGEEAEDVV